MMTWQTYVGVMAGGAAGVGARLFLSNVIANQFGQSFPWGTLIVNLSGCVVIGFFSGMTGPDGFFMTSPLVRQIVMIGILGGYTTFSSFSLQTINLLTDGEFFYAAANILASLLLCLLGTWIGLVIAGVFQPK
ncbi:MAG: fluoride efflux transporter CrcB [Terrimicrobiaceae bacterium]